MQSIKILLAHFFKSIFAIFSKPKPITAPLKDADYFAQKLAEGARLRNNKRVEIIKEINKAILDFHDIGRRSKFISKEIKTVKELATYLNKKYLFELMDCDLRIDKETAKPYRI
jgi:hypothetical protein